MGRTACSAWTAALYVGCGLAIAAGPRALASPAPASAAAEAHLYNIPAQSLSAALLSFATQADISIGLASVSLTNRVSRPLAGTETVESALRRLLAGTGLSFERIDAATWRIFEAQSIPSSAPPVREALVPLTLPALEEITVTAAKRALSLQTTAISVAAVTGTTAMNYGLRSSRDVTSLVAGLATTNQAPGKNKFIVRGLSDGPFTGNTQSTVGVYIDETRAIFNAPDPNLALVDIDRVEVIRGPQSTLYGAGSIGGLVRLITRQPVFGVTQLEAATDGSASGRSGASGAFAAVANVPMLGDRMAMRAVAYARHDGGYINDTLRGARHINQSDTSGGRAVARLALSQEWTLRAGVLYQKTDNDDTQYADASMPRYARATFHAEPSNSSFFEGNIAVEGELSWADLISSTAWIDHHANATYDASQALPVLLMEPPQPTAFTQINRYETFSHETRLVSLPGGRWQWLGGIFVSHRNNTSDLALTRLDRTPRFIFYSKNRADRGTELAGFGEATYTFASRIALTAGLRSYRSTERTSANNAELIDVGPAQAFGENQKTGVTPKVGISYQLNSSQLLYAQMTQGFRMGGINIAAAIAPRVTSGGRPLTVSNFDSDRLWNFEIGSKNVVLGEHATLNGTIFYQHWENAQADLIRPSGIFFTANVGDVRNFGFEADLTYVPLPHVQVIANVSWNRPKLSTTAGALAGSVINGLPAPPQLSGTVAAQYEVPLAGDNTAVFNLKYGFVGKARLARGVMANAAVSAYHVIDLRAALQRPHWKFSAYVENVTDNATNAYAFGNPFSLSQVPQKIPMRPRTFGATVAWAY